MSRSPFKVRSLQKATAKHRANRRKFLDDLKNRPCMDCGGMFPPYCMDFDHRDPSQKKFGIGSCKVHGMKALLEEIAKCDIVCANCHRIRTHSKGDQTIALAGSDEEVQGRRTAFG